MIIDLLTIPQGHKFDHRVNTYLVSRSTQHPLLFDMPHDHVWKKKLTPKQPQVPPPGVRPRRHNENPISFIFENKHKVWYKNL